MLAHARSASAGHFSFGLPHSQLIFTLSLMNSPNARQQEKIAELQKQADAKVCAVRIKSFALEMREPT